MKTRGRKTLLNATLQKKICALLEKGVPIRTCCEATGIGERTYFDWREQHPHFSQACAHARAASQQRLIAIIERQAPDDWKAASWLLEKLYPREYGRDASEPMPPQSREAAELAEKEFREAMQLMEKADNIERAARNASN
jgi:hypothetical protein